PRCGPRRGSVRNPRTRAARCSPAGRWTAATRTRRRRPAVRMPLAAPRCAGCRPCARRWRWRSKAATARWARTGPAARARRANRWWRARAVRRCRAGCIRPGGAPWHRRRAGADRNGGGSGLYLRSCSFGFELRGCVAAKQVTYRVAVQAVADPAQVAYQPAQFAQGRAELGQAVVGEAVDGGAVLVEDRVGAVGGRVQARQGAVQPVHQRRKSLHEFTVEAFDGAVGGCQGLLELLAGLARRVQQRGDVLATLAERGGGVLQVGQGVLDAGDV